MSTDRSLPWCRGPKLHPLPVAPGSSLQVEILEKLGEGLHAEVYRAKINSDIYAIKVASTYSFIVSKHMCSNLWQFRLFRASELCSPHDLEKGYISVDEVLNEVDPFHAECRAYGRLKETDNEHLAVRCHGYLHLSSTQEHKLDALGNIFHRDKWNQRQPLRAIVKELVPPSQNNFKFNMISQMQHDLRTLNKLGIVIFDLRADNYVGGRVADFSQAHTTPHHLLDLENPDNNLSTIKELCARDFCAFDGIMDSWNKQNPRQKVWNRFFPNRHFGRRLRNSSRYDAWYFDQDGATSDAARYDWKKIKKTHHNSQATIIANSKVAKKKSTRRKRR